MRCKSPRALFCALLTACTLSSGSRPALSHDHVEFLPPALPWDGASRELALPPEHEWATPCERTGLTETPRYDETIAWLRKLAAATRDIELVSIGTSAEGRTIWMAVASTAESKTPEGLAAADKPIVLAQAGIHSGEIDGKDAGLMLLRDMTVLGTRAGLLRGASLLFVPILAPDAHERFSAHSRINQRGPVEMGWRSNARNLNLNRDYTKLETNEIRAVLDVILAWQPDLYLDLHVTDGADYQYDITWAATPTYGWSPGISTWVEDVMQPAVYARLEEMGHIPGPLVWPLNGRDPDSGVLVWMGSPRFSNPYGAARHLPTILVENHSLKPYDQRVLGTYVFLEATLELIGRESASLAKATKADRARRMDPVILAWQVGDAPRIEKRRFLGVRSEVFESPISGAEVLRWTGEKTEEEVRFIFADQPRLQVRRPQAYYIPAGWSAIAGKLRAHGIEVETLGEPATLEAELYRLPDAGLAEGGSAFDHRGGAYEGRVRVDPGTLVVEKSTVSLPAGSFRVRTDQPLGTLAVLLLEPESEDSFFQWGYFLEVLTQPEYAESYVMEPMAHAMMERDPELARAFREKLEGDADFAANPRARLDWFYRRTPYFDERYRLYPVARSLE
jgi:murein tripeptide amidase MpaA